MEWQDSNRINPEVSRNSQNTWTLRPKDAVIKIKFPITGHTKGDLLRKSCNLIVIQIFNAVLKREPKYHCFCWCNTIFDQKFCAPFLTLSPNPFSAPSFCFDTLLTNLPSCSISPYQSPASPYLFYPSPMPPLQSGRSLCCRRDWAHFSSIRSENSKLMQPGSWKLTPVSWTRQKDTAACGLGDSRRPLWLQPPFQTKGLKSNRAATLGVTTGIFQ